MVSLVVERDEAVAAETVAVLPAVAVAVLPAAAAAASVVVEFVLAAGDRRCAQRGAENSELLDPQGRVHFSRQPARLEDRAMHTHKRALAACTVQRFFFCRGNVRIADFA